MKKMLTCIMLLSALYFVSCSKTSNPKVEDPKEEVPPPPPPPPPPTTYAHGSLRSVVATGSGTVADFNDGNYTFEGHRHMHHRFTDFGQATTTVPVNNTKAGWQSHLNGIYPIITSSDFNSQSVESGATVELTGGPTKSGKWLRRQYTDAMNVLFPGNIRLRNWNLFDNTAYRSAVYVSFYLKTFQNDDGKTFRMFMKRGLPSTDKFDFWIGRQSGTGKYHWRLEYGAGEEIGYCDETFVNDTIWQRIELLFDFDADTYAFVVDGSLQKDISKGYMGVVPNQLKAASYPTYALLGNTLTPRLEDGHHVGWAQPYASFSLKRIELADSANWNTKTKSVPQPVKSWSSDNVEFIVNQGNFADLTNKHIFYVNGLTATYLGAL